MWAKVAVFFVTVWVAYACILPQRRLSDPLFISAFNIQVFGKSKMSKPDVVKVLVDIVQRYDLIMIQEIRDVDVVAFPELVDEVNAESQLNGIVYESILGPRVGRTSSKEQYGFIYRPDKLRPVKQYQYNDDAEDKFEREPYVVEFERLTNGDQKLFSMIPLHAKPDDAVNEMNELIPVYEDSVEHTGNPDSVIIGDLNADCSYVCLSCWESVVLKHDARFSWMIKDDADTTVSTTNCAYDRIITTGDMTINAHGAKVFDFESEYGLSYEEAKDVSDHYPVEFLLD